jgi:hypothetical protein
MTMQKSAALKIANGESNKLQRTGGTHKAELRGDARLRPRETCGVGLAGRLSHPPNRSRFLVQCLGSTSPGAPTDPDVRDYRIRFLR